MAKRGLIGELLHQSQQAQKRRLQAERSAHRDALAAARRAEQAQRASERSTAQFARSSAAEAKALEREAKRLHEEARLAEVEQLNAQLAETHEEIDRLLAATLEVDDYVDLETLKQRVEHPPFARSDLELAHPPLPPLTAPVEPAYSPPPGAPKLFGRKKHAEVEAQARAEFDGLHRDWQAMVTSLPSRQAQRDADHAELERRRLHDLQAARASFEAECRRRDADVAAANEQIDNLLSGLQYGVESAIQEYVSIVLSNSVYPECFPVDHDFSFDSSLNELALTVSVAAPDSLPNVKEFKYTRSKDEISSTALPIREQKERYANAIAQVALRSIHEVFEADRAGQIQSVSLLVVTDALDVGTGVMTRIPLVAVAADRNTFLGFDLSNVVPMASLQRLGALVSKSPFDLVAIDTSKGVRGR